VVFEFFADYFSDVHLVARDSGRFGQTFQKTLYFILQRCSARDLMAADYLGLYIKDFSRNKAEDSLRTVQIATRMKMEFKRRFNAFFTLVRFSFREKRTRDSSAEMGTARVECVFGFVIKINPYSDSVLINEVMRGQTRPKEKIGIFLGCCFGKLNLIAAMFAADRSEENEENCFLGIVGFALCRRIHVGV